MTGHELQHLREEMGLSRKDFADRIGYAGLPDNNYREVERMETGARRVPRIVSRMAWMTQQMMFERAIPRDNFGMPIFPDWVDHVEPN